VEPIRNLFAALFLSSIGMLIHVHFLWNHVDILLASVILVIVVKTTIAAAVTKAFGYSIRTSFHVSWLAMLVGKRETNWRWNFSLSFFFSWTSINVPWCRLEYCLLKLENLLLFFWVVPPIFISLRWTLSLSLSVRAHACVEVRMPLKMQMHIFFIIRKSQVCLGLGFSSSWTYSWFQIWCDDKTSVF